MLGSQNFLFLLFFYNWMQLKGRLRSYWTNIWELLCCTCTIAMHLFRLQMCILYESVKVSLKEKLFVLSTLSVWGLSWAFTISTLVSSVQVLAGSLKEGRGWVLHQSYLTTIALLESHRLLIIPTPHPPHPTRVFIGSVFVQPNAPTLLLSKRSEVRHLTRLTTTTTVLIVRGSSSLLACELSVIRSQGCRLTCLWRALLITNSRNCSRVKSNAVVLLHCVTQPLLLVL